MKPRIQSALSTETLFANLLYTPLSWPGKEVRLERNSLLDYHQRSTSANISVAELYHENSKLFPQMLSELTASFADVESFRREFLRRRAAVQHACPAVLDLGRRQRELLAAIATSTEAELLYGIELRVMAGEMVATYEPVSDRIKVVKQLSAKDINMLRTALRLFSAPEEPPYNGPLLFILGCFARNDILFGPRGYRRTLVEAGQVAQEVLRQAKQLGIATRLRYDFTDRDVDSVLEADGVEQGTLIVVELDGGRPDANS